MVNTASTFKGGGVQVAHSLIEEWAQATAHEFLVVLGQTLSALVDRAALPSNMRTVQLDYRPAQRVLRPRDQSADLKRFEADFAPDVVFTTSGPAYWRPRAPHLMGFNLPHYLYPESPFFSELASAAERLKWRLQGQVIHHFARADADAYVVQTDDINHRLRAWLGTDRVTTVSNTVSRAYHDQRPQARPARPRSAAAPAEVLVLSAAYRHKHLELIDEIIAVLRLQQRRDVRFVMTLPPADFDRLVKPEHRGWVDNVGPQRPQDCPALYARADAVLLPTLLECFSANYVEAMAMQRPIVTTDLGFAHTVCREAALYFQPMNPRAALAQLDRALFSSSARAGLIGAGQRELARFGSAAARAEAYLSLCEQLVRD